MTERQYKDSGIEWIGDIPNDWEVIKIKYLQDTSQKDSFIDGDWIESPYIIDSGIRYLTSGNIGDGVFKHQGNGYISDKTFEVLNCKYAYPNDLIISRLNAPYGRACILPNDENKYVLAVDNVILRTKQNKQFLCYVMQCDGYHSNVEEKSAGTAMKRISRSKLGHIQLPLPSFEEQQQIADFLDSKTAAIDSAIQAQKDIVEKLKEYKQAVITEAVTKGLNRDAEMKNSGIEWIGEVPSTWSVLPIKALFGERKHKNKDMLETNLLSLSYGNIKRKDINSNNGLLPENFSGYNIVETGDIVLRLTDLQNDHKSLRTGLVKEHGIITSAYVTLAPKHEVNSEYYHYLLHSYDIQKVFYTMGEGIRQSLDFETLKKNVSVLVPSPEEQKNIVEYINKKCESVENSIVRINAIIEKLEEYKKSIIYNAVTGKIDCRKDVIPE